MVLGAAHIGRTLVEALHEEHEITVIDIDPRRLASLSDHYDIRTVEGDGTTEKTLRKAGVEDVDLFIGCSPREEANLVGAMLAKRLSGAQTIVRTTSAAYLDAWRERHLDVDFMVSPEIETANAISATLGLPAARHTDVFAEGKVHIVELDVPVDAAHGALIGRELRTAAVPADSKVAALIRGEQLIVPRGYEQILPGDRVVVIASPTAAREWSRIAGRGDERVDDVVIFGCGRMGTTIAEVLLERGIRLRMVDAQRERVREVAESLPGVRAFHAHAFDPDFLEHERIGRASAGVFCLNDDAKNLYGAILAKSHGMRLTIALVHDAVSVGVYERRRRRRDQPAPSHRRGDGPLRARPTHPPDRDARRRPLRGPRHDRPARLGPRRHALQRDARHRLGDRRGHPRRRGDVPARLRHAAGGRPRDHLRRVPPRILRGARALRRRASSPGR